VHKRVLILGIFVIGSQNISAQTSCSPNSLPGTLSLQIMPLLPALKPTSHILKTIFLKLLATYCVGRRSQEGL